MKKAAKITLSMVLLLSVASCLQAKIDFIDADLNKFIDRFVPKAQQKSFKKYYTHLNKKMKAADENKCRATYKYLYELALNSLEQEHADWFAALNPYVRDAHLTLDAKFDDARKVIKIFLTRYGAYQEYCLLKERMKQGFKNPQITLAKMKNENDSSGIWGTMKSYARKVGNWVGFGTTAA